MRETKGRLGKRSSVQQKRAENRGTSWRTQTDASDGQSPTVYRWMKSCLVDEGELGCGVSDEKDESSTIWNHAVP